MKERGECQNCGKTRNLVTFYERKTCQSCATVLGFRNKFATRVAPCGMTIESRRSQSDSDWLVVGAMKFKNYRCELVNECRQNAPDWYMKCLDYACQNMEWRHGWRFADKPRTVFYGR